MTDYLRLPAFGAGGRIHIVVETPKGSRAKLKFEPDLGVFLFSRPLALGLAYPFDWGFVPSTCGEDGDPLDALVIHDPATAPGVVIAAKPVGVLQVRQTQDGKSQRNDRFVFKPIAEGAAAPGDGSPLDARVKSQLETFFIAAVQDTGKRLSFLGWRDGAFARACLRRAARQFQSNEKAGAKDA